MNEPILNFINNTESIVETDYGDFMRRENLYFLQLREALGPQTSSEAQLTLKNMQDYLQFSPDWNLESTKRQIVADATKLLQLVKINPAQDMQENTVHHFHP